MAEAREPIAVVGVACRFPGATDATALWTLLREGGDALATSDSAGRLAALDRFDAAFFGLSPREAERLDPQQRLLLELSWEALEDAGVVPARVAGADAGVFVGLWTNDYEARVFADASSADFHGVQGTGRYAASGRISHVLGLRGPSLTIDTGCSSSLVAVHLACRSLWSGESTVALAAGANVVLEKQITRAYARAGMLSEDGRCRFGDARGAGYVRSDGAGVVVLKPLSLARADGDRIYALILGSAVNNDGGASGSFGRPAREGQEDLLRKAVADAGVDPTAIGYVEVHGTGTRAGDPVELSALGGVLCAGRPADRPLLTGSVKTNVGHTEAAAGMAGLIKVALSLRNGVIPPSLHFRDPNPAVGWGAVPLEVVTELTAWPGERERFAGVSSFGIGGTNAHIILAAAPPSADEYGRADSDPGALLLPLSARSPAALRSLARAYAELLDTEAASPVDVCHTAALHRSHHAQRAAIIGGDRDALRAALEAAAAGVPHPSVQLGASRGARRVAFVFPGQGSQWPGMGRGLRAAEPAFDDALRASAAAVERHAGWSPLDVLDDDAALGDIGVVQPTLFAVQVALAALWRSWGIEPAAVVGHSMGEVAAAHVAGALSLDEAARIICTRSALLRRVSGRGGMALTELSLPEAGAALRGREDVLSIAVSNGPRSTVIAGDVVALDTLLQELDARGVFCRPIRVDVASHSPQVDPLLGDLRSALGAVAVRDPIVPMMSTVTGRTVAGGALDAEYWVRNLREPVRFAEAVALLSDDGCDVFVEVSPHPILLPSIDQSLAGRSPTLAASLRRDHDERTAMLDSLAALYVSGCDVAWQRVQSSGRRIALPSYPWQRERFWVGSDVVGARADRSARAHALLGEPEPLPGGGQVWESTLDVARTSWLEEHRVRDVAVVPASAIVEMALWAGRGFGSGVALENVEIASAVRLDAGPVAVRLEVTPGATDRATFRLSTRATEDGEWTSHATGVLHTASDPSPTLAAATADDAAGDGDAHYAAMAGRGLGYGPSFRGVERIVRTEAGAVARLRFTSAALDEPFGFVVHPCLLDAALQTALAAAPTTVDSESATVVPVAFGSVVVHRSPSTVDVLDCRATLVEAMDGAATVDLTLAESNGEVLVELRGIRFAPLTAELAGAGILYALEWQSSERASGSMSRRWLILSDRSGVGSALADRFEAAGDRYTLLVPGDATWPVDASGVTDRRAYDALLETVLRAEEPLGVVHLRALDESGGAEAMAARLAEGALPLDIAHLAAALAARAEHSARLFVVTAGAHDDGAADSPVQAMAWGVGAVVASEQPALGCTLIDLPVSPAAEDLDALARECRSEDAERRVQLRGGARSVARLARLSEAEVTGDAIVLASAPASFRAEAGPARTLDGLCLRAIERPAPDAGEVEIEVAACGVNFMNVLSALGACPGYADGVGPLGVECAGVVTRVGRDVRHVRPGDEVVAIAFGCLGTHTITDARLVAPKPRSLDASAAATLPIAFVTAAHALRELARLRKGERVLIHAATGGVGMAAVQLAQRIGAEVFATAGSDAKRALLRELGIAHVFDSRTTDFAAGVLAATNGEGVDVVLNSLTGDAIAAGLSALAPYGRFVEIGKRDIYGNATVGLAPFRRNLSYFAVDLDLMARERPDVVGELLNDVVARVEAGELAPLPVRTFGIADAADAFRTMAEAGHVGKLAVSLSPEARRAARVLAPAAAIRRDATYLITGGTGALGLVAARTLVARGATHLVLLARNALTDAVRAEVAQLEHTGARVITLSADVSDETALAGALAEIRRTLPPLRGIVHAAGVLDDATVGTLDGARVRRVLAPKALGAWLLHALTARDALDFFVLFSSASALLGLAGQANYAAANAALDALARHRRALGLPATSIAWGPWMDVGLAAAQSTRGARLEAQGLRGLTPGDGAAALDRLLATSRANVCAMTFDADAWTSVHGEVSLLRLLAGRTRATETSAIVRMLREAAAAERAALLTSHVTDRVAHVLRQDRTRVPADAPLRSLGLDSLLTLELRNRLESDLGLRLSATLVWNHPTVAALASHLLDLLFPAATESAASGASENAPLAMDTDLETLVEAELERVEALLAQAERRDRREEHRVGVR